MIVKSQDRSSVCNTFDFTIRCMEYGQDSYEIVNKLDSVVY